MSLEHQNPNKRDKRFEDIFLACYFLVDFAVQVASTSLAFNANQN